MSIASLRAAFSDGVDEVALSLARRFKLFNFCSSAVAHRLSGFVPEQPSSEDIGISSEANFAFFKPSVSPAPVPGMMLATFSIAFITFFAVVVVGVMETRTLAPPFAWRPCTALAMADSHEVGPSNWNVPREPNMRNAWYERGAHMQVWNEPGLCSAWNEREMNLINKNYARDFCTLRKCYVDPFMHGNFAYQ